MLDYSHCSLQQVPKEIFSFERTLEELYLDANQIEELPKVSASAHGHGGGRGGIRGTLSGGAPSSRQLAFRVGNHTEVPENKNMTI